MSEKLDAPTPEHAEHIQWEGSDRVVIRPEEYEELYQAAMLASPHPAPALPADWVAVPREATTAMMESARSLGANDSWVTANWDAMLAAAPPIKPQGGEA